MKGSKIKIVTIIAVVILIALVGFIGVYTQVQNRMENQVKDYSFAMDIDGARFIELTPSTATKEDEEETQSAEVASNEEESSQSEETENKEAEKVNPDEVLTKENYKLSKEIIEEKLKNLGVQEYIVRLDEETGKITVEIEENLKTDEILGNLITVGKFEIKDAETNEVLMTNDNIKSAQVMYGSSSQDATGGTSVYLNIDFDKEGAKKLEEISSTYTPAPENTNTTNTTSSETTEESAAENTESTETTDSSTEEAADKKVTLTIDDNEIMSSSFSEVIKTGSLQLSYGQATTDKTQLNENVDKANQVARILNNRLMPIEYEASENEYLLSDITEDVLVKVEIAIAIIALIGLIILVVRHKIDGLLAAIAYVGLAGALLLIIRYTNTVLSLEGIAAIVITLILNYVFTAKLLKTKSLKETYKDFFIKIIPVIIMSIVFCFINWLPILSFGMVMFWGIVTIAVYNFIITGTLLKLRMGGTNNETK